jgi:hypothetical protein
MVMINNSKTEISVMDKIERKFSELSSTNLFVFESKNDLFLIFLFLLLSSFFLIGGFFLNLQ